MADKRKPQQSIQEWLVWFNSCALIQKFLSLWHSDFHNHLCSNGIFCGIIWFRIIKLKLSGAESVYKCSQYNRICKLEESWFSDLVHDIIVTRPESTVHLPTSPQLLLSSCSVFFHFGIALMSWLGSHSRHSLQGYEVEGWVLHWRVWPNYAVPISTGESCSQAGS